MILIAGTLIRAQLKHALLVLRGGRRQLQLGPALESHHQRTLNANEGGLIGGVKNGAPAFRYSASWPNRASTIAKVSTETTLIDNLLVRDRLLALLSGFFGMVTLLLVAIGSYGVLSYSVVQRTREIGIRMALGARAFQVIRLVISEIAVTVALGVVAGLAGGFVLGHYVTRLLFEVKPGHGRRWSFRCSV